MRRRGFFPLVLLLIISAGMAWAASPRRIRLDGAALKAAQLRVRTLRGAVHARRIAAYGVVLDPAPLAALAAKLAVARGRIAVAKAKVDLAAAEEARVAGLYRAAHNVALAELQKAQSALAVTTAEEAVARSKLAELETGIRTAWGSRLAAAIASQANPLPALEAGRQLLVRIDLPLGAGLARPPLQASGATPDELHVVLRFVSRSPRTQKGIAGQGFFYLMDPTNSAPIGTLLAVSLDTAAPQSGVVVPLSAVVWDSGEALVYRQTGPGAFAAVPISTAVRAGDGYFVPDRALAPGAKVVTRGAALLLSGRQSAKSPQAGKSGAGNRHRRPR